MFSLSAGQPVSIKVIPLMVSPCNALYGGDQLGYQKHSICWSWGGDLYTLTLIAMLFDSCLGSAVDLGKQRNGIQEMMGHCPHPLCTLGSFTHSGTEVQGCMFDVYRVSQACFSHIFRKKGLDSLGSQQLG